MTTASPSPAQEFIVNPFTVIIDQREKAPFSFTGIQSDADTKFAPLVIPTRLELLVTGDYTIEGFEPDITVERKSVADLIGTLTAGRDRFEDELSRAQEMKFAAVVVEGDWSAIMQHCKESAERNQKRAPSVKTIFRSVVTFQQRFMRVHWWFCADRRMAEQATFRILERYFRDRLAENTRRSITEKSTNSVAEPSGQLIAT